MANSLNKVTTKSILDATIATADLADDSVTLAKMAAGTDGNIISYDASGNPVAIATGSDGQVLTSTGAGSPPAFEDVPAGGATINNATANELVTVASTTTQLDAEANLTFDGSTLAVTGDTTSKSLSLTDSGTSNTILTVATDDQSPWAFHLHNKTYHDGNSGLKIYQYNAGNVHIRNQGNSEYTNLFFEQGDGSTTRNLVKLQSDGVVELYHAGNKKFETSANGITVTGDIFCGTNGKGISFESSDNNGVGGTATRFDDYEEGEFSLSGSNSITFASAYNTGSYVKIGNIVHCQGMLQVDSDNSNSHFGFMMPFTSVSGLSDSADAALCSVGTYDWNLPLGSDSGNVYGLLSANATQLNFFQGRDSSARVDLAADSGAYMSFSFTYRT